MEALVRLCARAPTYTFAPGSPESSARLVDEELLL
jgi:hypothetical protein